jgi:hypothetical protein
MLNATERHGRLQHCTPSTRRGRRKLKANASRNWSMGASCCCCHRGGGGGQGVSVATHVLEFPQLHESGSDAAVLASCASDVHHCAARHHAPTAPYAAASAGPATAVTHRYHVTHRFQVTKACAVAAAPAAAAAAAAAPLVFRGLGRASASAACCPCYPLLRHNIVFTYSVNPNSEPSTRQIG